MKLICVCQLSPSPSVRDCVSSVEPAAFFLGSLTWLTRNALKTAKRMPMTPHAIIRTCTATSGCSSRAEGRGRGRRGRGEQCVGGLTRTPQRWSGRSRAAARKASTHHEDIVRGLRVLRKARAKPGSALTASRSSVVAPDVRHRKLNTSVRVQCVRVTPDGAPKTYERTIYMRYKYSRLSVVVRASTHFRKPQAVKRCAGGCSAA